MADEHRLDEILQAVASGDGTATLGDAWNAFFQLEELIFLCDSDRPRAPLVIRFRDQPTLLVFTSTARAGRFAEQIDKPKLFQADGHPVTLTLSTDRAVALMVEHFQQGVRQFLLNHGGEFLFGSSARDFLQELARRRNPPPAGGNDLSDEFDVLVEQLLRAGSEALRDAFWEKVRRLERVYVVCPPTAPWRPDLQYFEVTEGRPELFAVAFTNERHATAYGLRMGYATEGDVLNLFVTSCAALVDSLQRAGDLGLYGVYFNPLTRPFHRALSRWDESSNPTCA